MENDISVMNTFDKLNPNNKINETSDNKELLELVSLQASEILSNSKKHIINHFRNVNHIDVQNDYPYENLSFSFDEAIKYYTNFNNFHLDSAEPYFEEELDWLYRSVFIGIFKSYQGQDIYSPGFNFNNFSRLTNTTKLVDDIYYTVKTKLSEEIKYMPHPISLKDAIKLRNKREIKRFREVLRCWIQSVNNGDAQLEKIIRKDIQKANQELKRINSIREYTNSSMNFWLNSLGGHIPIFSNILTVTNMFLGLYEKYSFKMNNWIMLTNKSSL